MDLNAEFSLSPDLKKIEKELDKVISLVKTKFKKLGDEFSVLFGDNNKLKQDLVKATVETKKAFEKMQKTMKPLEATALGGGGHGGGGGPNTGPSTQGFNLLNKEMAMTTDLLSKMSGQFKQFSSVTGNINKETDKTSKGLKQLVEDAKKTSVGIAYPGKALYDLQKQLKDVGDISGKASASNESFADSSKAMADSTKYLERIFKLLSVQMYKSQQEIDTLFNVIEEGSEDALKASDKIHEQVDANAELVKSFEDIDMSSGKMNKTLEKVMLNSKISAAEFRDFEKGLEVFSHSGKHAAETVEKVKKSLAFEVANRRAEHEEKGGGLVAKALQKLDIGILKVGNLAQRNIAEGKRGDASSKTLLNPMAAIGRLAGSLIKDIPKMPQAMARGMGNVMKAAGGAASHVPAVGGILGGALNAVGRAFGVLGKKTGGKEGEEKKPETASWDHLKGIAAGLSKSLLSAFSTITSGIKNIGSSILNQATDLFKKILEDAAKMADAFDEIQESTFEMRRMAGGPAKVGAPGQVMGAKVNFYGQTNLEQHTTAQMNQILKSISGLHMNFESLNRATDTYYKGMQLSNNELFTFAGTLQHFGISSIGDAVKFMSELGDTSNNLEGKFDTLRKSYGQMIASAKELNVDTNYYIQNVQSAATDLFRFDMSIITVEGAFKLMYKAQEDSLKGMKMTKQALNDFAKATLGIQGNMTEAWAAAVAQTFGIGAKNNPLQGMFAMKGEKVTEGAGGGVRFEKSNKMFIEAMVDSLKFVEKETSNQHMTVEEKAYAQMKLIAQGMYAGNEEQAKAFLTLMNTNDKDGNKFSDKMKQAIESGDEAQIKAMKDQFDVVEKEGMDQRKAMIRVGDQLDLMNKINLTLQLQILQTTLAVIHFIVNLIMTIIKILYIGILGALKFIIKAISNLGHIIGDFFTVLAAKIKMALAWVVGILAPDKAAEMKSEAGGELSRIEAEQSTRTAKAFDEMAEDVVDSATGYKDIGNIIKGQEADALKVAEQVLSTVETFFATFKAMGLIAKRIGEIGNEMVVMPAARGEKAETKQAEATLRKYGDVADHLAEGIEGKAGGMNVTQTGRLIESPELVKLGTLMQKSIDEANARMNKLSTDLGAQTLQIGKIFDKVGTDIINTVNPAINILKNIQIDLDALSRKLINEIAVDTLKSSEQDLQKLVSLYGISIKDQKENFDSMIKIQNDQKELISKHPEMPELTTMLNKMQEDSNQASKNVLDMISKFETATTQAFENAETSYRQMKSQAGQSTNLPGQWNVIKASIMSSFQQIRNLPDTETGRKQFQDLMEYLKNTISLMSSIPHFQSGGIIRQDQIAMLHKNEVVIPSDITNIAGGPDNFYQMAMGTMTNRGPMMMGGMGMAGGGMTGGQGGSVNVNFAPNVMVGSDLGNNKQFMTFLSNLMDQMRGEMSNKISAYVNGLYA